MAENRKFNINEVEVIEDTIAAELTVNDNIVEYIQPSNLDILKARYAAVEEDESIRNEGFDSLKKSSSRKVRPEDSFYGYYSAPLSTKEEIQTDVKSPLAQVFDSTKSEFDADTVSFGDINIDLPQKPQSPQPTQPLIENVSVIENVAVESEAKPEAAPKKRGRPRKVVEPQATPADAVPAAPKKRGRPKKVVEPETLPEPVVEVPPAPMPEPEPAPAPVFNNRYGFDTHTRVIFIDESAEDGIKVNSDTELDSAFSDGENTGRRKWFWSRKKK